jgi:hypothetical protein
MTDTETADAHGTKSTNGSGSERASLGALLKSIPDLIGRLIRDELRAARLEFTSKLKAAGIGVGLLVGAAVFGWFTLAVLIATAVLGLATALPAWLAALIIGVLLLVITAILALVGIRKLKAGAPPIPKDSIESVKEDIRTVKGTN